MKSYVCILERTSFYQYIYLIVKQMSIYIYLIKCKY